MKNNPGLILTRVRDSAFVPGVVWCENGNTRKMTEVGSRGDHNKRQRPRRKKKPKRGAYTPDELIKLWGVGQSQVSFFRIAKKQF